MFATRYNDDFRPRMVLGYTESAHAARLGRYFRRLGWEVHLAAGAREALRLADALNPRVLVLDTDQSEALHAEMGGRVIWMTPERRHEPIEAFAETILGACLAEAG